MREFESILRAIGFQGRWLIVIWKRAKSKAGRFPGSSFRKLGKKLNPGSSN